MSRFEDKYTLTDEVLGEGGFAKVVVATNNRTRTPVAVKIFQNTVATDLLDIRAEIQSLTQLRHQNIVRVFDTYERETEFYVVMEMIPGGHTLLDLFDNESPFFTQPVNERNVRDIVQQVAAALRHAWGRKIAHRDVKLDNVLVRDWDTFTVVLADFNLSKQVIDDGTVLKTDLGTMGYKAPEIFRGNQYDYKCDIWSLGVVAFVLLSWGYMPYNPPDPSRLEETERETVDKQMERLMRSKFGRPWEFKPEKAWAKISLEAKRLVERMLSVDPRNRISYGRIKKDKWITRKKWNNLQDLNRTNAR